MRPDSAKGAPRLDAATPRALGTVFACAVGNMVSSTPMVNSTFGLFLIPVTAALGWPRAKFSAALALISLIGFVDYPLFGRIADRIGSRPVILAGNIVFAAALAAMGLVNGSTLQFFALVTLLGVTAAAPSTVLLSKVVSGWFFRKRGLYLGLTAGLGNGLGCTVVPMIGGVLLAHYGWRGTYASLGLIILFFGGPALWLLMREAPRLPAAAHPGGEDPLSSGLTGAEARRTPAFWMIMAAISIGAGSLGAVFTHVVPMLVDRGISPTVATLALSALAFSNTVWQIALGKLLDRVSGPRLAAPCILVALAGLFLLAHARQPGLLILGGLLTGIGSGTEYGLVPYFIPRYFGFRSYGEVYGSIFGMIMLTMGFAPFLMDLVYDLKHSYDLALYGIDAALVLCAILIARLPGYTFPVLAPASASGARRPPSAAVLPGQGAPV
jgi:MFS family permease